MNQLMAALQPVHWPTFAVASARTAGVMFVGPLWSMASIPAQLRGAMAVIITLAILPTMPHAGGVDGLQGVVVPMIAELLLGLAIGMSAAVFVYAVSVAAEVISLQMGLSLGAALASAPELGSPGVGQALGYFTLSVFASLGGHLALIAALARSYQVIPPGAPMDPAAGGHAIVALAAGVFSIAVRVAAPVMVALLITNLALAILNRAVPQLNTMMVAVPVTVAAGLVTLGAALPLLVPLVGSWAAGVGNVADGIVGAFALAAASH